MPDKFLLYVGSVEERKNLLLAVKGAAFFQPFADQTAGEPKEDLQDFLHIFVKHRRVLDSVTLLGECYVQTPLIVSAYTNNRIIKV